MLFRVVLFNPFTGTDRSVISWEFATEVEIAFLRYGISSLLVPDHRSRPFEITGTASIMVYTSTFHATVVVAQLARALVPLAKSREFESRQRQTKTLKIGSDCSFAKHWVFRS
jgi:hypothetical protein